jgi:hypothetical protein
MKVTRPLSHVLLFLGGWLMFIDTLLPWQAVTVGKLTYSRNAWHGFWGLILGLMSLALLVNVAFQVGIFEFRFRLPYRLVSIALAPAILVFAAIKTINDDNSAWASYSGIALAGVLVVVALLSWKVKLAEKSSAEWGERSPESESARGRHRHRRHSGDAQ